MNSMKRHIRDIVRSQDEYATVGVVMAVVIVGIILGGVVWLIMR